MKEGLSWAQQNLSKAGRHGTLPRKMPFKATLGSGLQQPPVGSDWTVTESFHVPVPIFAILSGSLTSIAI
jgi:hypothetical protein